MDQECAAAIWPLTLKIKQSRGLEQNDQPIEHTFWRLKILIAVTNSSTGNISVTTPWCGLLHWDVALHLVVGLFLSWFNYLHKPVAQVDFPLTRGSISWSWGYPQPSGRHPAQYLTFDPLQNSRSRLVLRSGNKNRGIKRLKFDYGRKREETSDFRVLEAVSGGSKYPCSGRREAYTKLWYFLKRAALIWVSGWWISTHVYFLSVDSQTSSSIGIELCCWQECLGHSVLALVCNNGEPQSTVQLLPFVTWFKNESWSKPFVT